MRALPTPRELLLAEKCCSGFYKALVQELCFHLPRDILLPRGDPSSVPPASFPDASGCAGKTEASCSRRSAAPTPPLWRRALAGTERQH